MPLATTAQKQSESRAQAEKSHRRLRNANHPEDNLRTSRCEVDRIDGTAGIDSCLIQIDIVFIGAFICSIIKSLAVRATRWDQSCPVSIRDKLLAVYPYWRCITPVGYLEYSIASKPCCVINHVVDTGVCTSASGTSSHKSQGLIKPWRTQKVNVAPPVGTRRALFPLNAWKSKLTVLPAAVVMVFPRRVSPAPVG